MSEAKNLHRLRPTEANTPIAPLRVLPPAAPEPPGAPANAEVAPAPARRQSALRPASDAWIKLAAPLREGQGIRVGALGVTGKGKTTAVVQFLEYLKAEQLAHLVIIHDIKLPTVQYPHERIVWEADAIIRRPPETYPATVVLRRRDIDHTPSVDLAARVTKHASYNSVRTTLVIDEFHRALTPAGREFTAPAVGELLSEGRAIGASLIWTTQIPQRVPTTAWDQSRIMLLGQGKKACAYLVAASVIDEETADAVAGLAVGQFVLVSPEEDWNGTVYQVPPPAPAAAQRSEIA